MLNPLPSDLGSNSAIYFAFTGRFGQYISTRDSSPVIGKRYNPKIFIRFWGDKEEGDAKHSNYIDIGYNHESNGQAINSKNGYDQAVSQAIANKDKGTGANDLISRSWNFLDVNYKQKKIQTIADTVKNKFFTVDASGYFGLKYFIPSKTEEFNGLGGINPQGLSGWETDPQGKPRQQVDGISAALKGSIYSEDKFKGKYYLGYTTGIHNAGTFNTWRAELTFNLASVDLPIIKQLDVPFTCFKQIGYNSDLAQYYKKVSSVGCYIDIGSI